jgi:hypothetical protein
MFEISEMFEKSISNVFVFALTIMHWIMFSGTILIILVTNDLSILTVANLFLYLVLMLNLIFGDCPISIIEKHHFGSSMIDNFSNLISNNIKNNFPLKQEINSSIQWILMAIMVCSTKIILLLIKYTFHEFLIE